MTDQEITGLDVEAVENEISRLPDVVACRIVADSLGRPLEVHVLARPGKHPKQLVRDVQSVALASFGLEVDRRIVSVVQLSPTGETRGDKAKPDRARVMIGAIESQIEGRRATIRITLSAGDKEATGYTEGSAASTTRLRIVASAAIDALRQLDDGAEALEVDDVSTMQVGSQEVVAVTLVHLDPPHEQELVGAALARRSPDVAVVRAVLDAVNRRLPYLDADHALA
jgi:hypothetical protein